MTEKPSVIMVPEMATFPHGARFYSASEMDAFLEKQACELLKARDCWGDASATLIIEEVAAALRGGAKSK